MVDTTNLLLHLIWLPIVCAYLRLIVAADDGTIITLTLNQIGELVEAAREPFFEQIVTNGRPTANPTDDSDGDDNAGGDKHWTELLDIKMIRIGKQIGAIQPIKEINLQIYASNKLISGRVRNEHCGQLAETECQQIVKETMAQLSARALIKMAKRIVKSIFLSQLLWSNEPNVVEKTKLFTWWYRFRYNVDSGVQFTDRRIVSEIRVGMAQYYNDIYHELKRLVHEFDKGHAHLADVLSIFDKKFGKHPIQMHPDIAELRSFDPRDELPSERLNVLMRKPVDKEVPVYVFSEKFPLPNKFGTIFKALGVTHRGVKVYDIEFHFGYREGIIIGDKLRKRSDPERGIKFDLIGWTKKSQWEVQKMFDEFNDFYMENGLIKEGKFSLSKYQLKENNCIHFSREFVEALLESDGQLKSSKWPPSQLKQPAINSPSCGFVTNCFVPSEMADSNE